ncbi:MAG: L,D-transpeptidase [Christensenellales bacterium]
MGKRILSFFVAAMLLLSGIIIHAEEPRLRFALTPEMIRPGRTERVGFVAVESGLASLHLEGPEGALTPIMDNIPVQAGENHLAWNGFDQTQGLIPQGEYRLVIQMGDERAEAHLIVGLESPRIIKLKIDNSHIMPGQPWKMSAHLNMRGKLMVVFHIADQLYEIFNAQVPEGETTVAWDGLIDGIPAPEGQHTLSILFLDDEGFAANQQHVTLTVEPVPEVPAVSDAVTPMPETVDSTALETVEPAVATQAPKRYTLPTKETVSKEEEGSSYWTLPVGEWNEEAIWKVMMQPLTVVVGGDQRDTYKLRAAKDESMKRENILGEITYESQGVHVIEQTDDGWSLVEVYNSSYGPNNRTRRGYGDTDDLIRGYVRTQNLKTITPRDDYGVLIDKLKQRLYVFKDGKKYTELLISTGIPTKQQPWNETPSGEFLMVSRVGQFNAGNLVCRMAMRINGGCLIHEVPYIENISTGYWDYSSQEAQLGTKASHGCIRVQRLNNDDGINMSWLWNNIKVNTKVLVWDDFPGRFYEYPDDSLALYYNPDRGQYYHLDQNCRSIKNRYLPLKGTMTYGELDDASYQKLTPCKSCNPPIRKAEIDKINRDNGF